MTMSVAFQGEPGAFSEEAAVALLGGDLKPHGVKTFDELVVCAATGATDYGILPVHNSIYGHIYDNYDLLLKYRDVFIVDQITFLVEQTLLGVPGSSIDNLRIVSSHAVALAQCRAFLGRHQSMNVEVVYDTAGAVRIMTECKDPRHGAIGPASLAERYNAQVLARGIQDRPDNYTRFFLLSRKPQPLRPARRAWIALHIADSSETRGQTAERFLRQGIRVQCFVGRVPSDATRNYGLFAELVFPAADEPSALPASEYFTLLGTY